MRVSTATVPVSSQGIAEQNTFTIAVTAKMFDDLMDKRYPDKPKAVIRELSANAADASNGKQFEVSLPTKMNPRLKIKDFGTGMPHEFVMRRYSCVGDSIKDQDNKNIGGFGVGSKVGFSVTDMFTVEVRLDGVKRTYTCYRDSERLPKIALTTEASTTEPNGTTVEIPIPVADIQAWHDAAKHVLQHFDPIPKINTEIKAPEYVMRGTSWGMRKKPDDYYARQRDRARVIMGCIPYPIEASQIGTSGVAQDVLNLPIDIFMPIGAVEILTNREGLEYDRAGRTAKAIKAAAAQVANELPTFLQRDIAACKTLWEARLKFQQIMHSSGFDYSLREHLVNTTKFNGHKLEFGQRLKSKPGAGLCYLTYRDLGKKNLSLAPGGEEFVDLTDDLIVLLDDLTIDKPLVRFKYALETKTIKSQHVLVIRGTNPKPILDEMGDPPTIRMQDLPDPPASLKTYIKSDVQPVFKWGGYAFHEHSYDVTQGGFYVQIDHGNAKRGESVIGNSYLNEVHKLAAELGIVIDEIYGIPMTHKRVPKKNPGWINFFDHVEEIVREKIVVEDLATQRANFDELTRFTDDMRDVAQLLLNHSVRPKKVKSKMAKLMDGFTTVKAAVKPKFGEFTRIVERLGIEVKEPKPLANLEKLAEEVNDRYQLLKRVASCISPNADAAYAASVVEYIDLID